MIIANDILNQLRHDIVSGVFAKDEKLPTREEFSRQYGASKATVQKALAALEREGFVNSRGALGTFISSTPPNKTDIAILLPLREEQITARDELFKLVHQEHHGLENHISKNLKYFYIDREQRGQDDFAKVAEEANRTRLNGVIMPFLPQPWMLEPFAKNNIPVVVLTDEEICGASTVWVDYSDFFRKALQYCKAQGCRRPALLCNITLPYHHLEDYLKAVAEQGLESERYLVQGQSEQHGFIWLKHNISAFVGGPKPADAIICSDETFLPELFSTLLDMNLIPGKDLHLVCERTFPKSTFLNFPVKFIGFDLYEIIGECLRALDALRAGGSPANKFKLINATENPTIRGRNRASDRTTITA